MDNLFHTVALLVHPRSYSHTNPIYSPSRTHIQFFFSPLELVSLRLDVKTNWRKIATGRYPAKALRRGDENSILRLPSSSSRHFLHVVCERAILFTGCGYKRPRAVPSVGQSVCYSCHFQRECSTRTRRVLSAARYIRPVRGPVLQARQLGYRSIEQTENQSGRVVITSYHNGLPARRGIRWRIANLYRGKHVVDATGRVLYNRSPQIYAIGSQFAGAMNEPRRRQRANHRHAVNDAHSGKSRGFATRIRTSDTVVQLVKIVIVCGKSFLADEMLT